MISPSFSLGFVKAAGARETGLFGRGHLVQLVRICAMSHAPAYPILANWRRQRRWAARVSDGDSSSNARYSAAKTSGMENPRCHRASLHGAISTRGIAQENASAKTANPEATNLCYPELRRAVRYADGMNVMAIIIPLSPRHPCRRQPLRIRRRTLAQEMVARARAKVRQGRSTAAPLSAPLRRASRAWFASVNGKVRVSVRTGTCGARARNSSPSRRVRFATEQIERSCQRSR